MATQTADLTFAIHTPETAPEGSRRLLEQARSQFGLIPNLLGELAESPTALEGYMTLSKLLGSASLSPGEVQVVLLTASHENDCGYCMAAHSTVAQQSLRGEVLGALRDGETLPDERLEALARFTRAVVRERGWVGSEELNRFLEAGFTRAQVLEVISGVALKTISNYTNHIAETPVDEAFSGQAWEKATA